MFVPVVFNPFFQSLLGLRIFTDMQMWNVCAAQNQKSSGNTSYNPDRHTNLRSKQNGVILVALVSAGVQVFLIT